MVDTKDNSNEEPKATFTYKDEDGVDKTVDASEFSQEGFNVFLDLLDDQEDIKRVQTAIRRNVKTLNDLNNGNAKRKQWLVDNEINKKEDNADVEEAVEVVEQPTGKTTKQ